MRNAPVLKPFLVMGATAALLVAAGCGSVVNVNTGLNMVSVVEVVTASASSTTYGAAETLTFQIPATAGIAAPTGTVQFSAGNTPLGAPVAVGSTAVTLGGQQVYAAVLTTSNLPVGAPVSITAVYTPGAGSVYPAQSPKVAVTVVAAPLSSDVFTAGSGVAGSPEAMSFSVPVAAGNAAPVATVTFTATVNGVVTVLGSAGLPLVAGATVNGVTTYSVTVTTAALPVGTNTITATLSTADPNYAGGTLQTTQTITAVAGAVSVTASPSAATYGSPETLTFLMPVVAGVAPPVGTVQWSAGAVSLGTPAAIGTVPVVIGGVSYYTATLTTSNLPVGAPTAVTASYSAGIGSAYASSSASTTLPVARAPLANDSVSASPNTVAVGATVTLSFSVPVAVGNAAPVATVTFTAPINNVTTTLGTAGLPLIAGATANGVTTYTANVTTTALPVGTNTITATLSAADPNYVGGALQTTQTITAVAGAVSVTASPSAATYGSPETLTFLMPVVAGAPLPVGTVQWSAGAVSLGTPMAIGTVPVVIGGVSYYTAALTTSNLPVGAPTTVTGRYSAGVGSAYASSSASTTLSVARAPLANDVFSASPNTVAAGATVTLGFSVPVAVGNAAPVATVTFTAPINSVTTTLGTAGLPLIAGATANGVTTYTATVTTTALPVGTNTITATLNAADPNYAGGALQTTQTVTTVTSAVSATASPSSATYGASETLTFLMPVVAGAPLPVGTVQWSAGAVNLGTPVAIGTVPVVIGGVSYYTAALTTSNLPVGAPATATASYRAGAGSAYASSSASVTLPVARAPLANDAFSASPSAIASGATVTLSFSVPVAVGNAAPTGTVTFSVPINNVTTTLGTAALPLIAGATANGVTTYTATTMTAALPDGVSTVTGAFTNTDPNYAGGSLTAIETVTFTQGTTMHGLVSAGLQPVNGANVQLYAAGSSGYGSSYPYTVGTSLLGANVVTTVADGGFEIAGMFICPTPSTQVYLVATGGTARLQTGPNPGIAMAAALGPCGQIAAGAHFVVNELTTVGTVWALAPFMATASSLGTSAGNNLGLVHAFTTVNKLVNVSTGALPGPALPAGAVLPTAKMNMLANILAACMNSTGGSAGDGSSCGTLYAATTVNGAVPSNTLTAALSMALHPATPAIVALATLSTAAGPFQTALTGTPSDFSLVVTHIGGFVQPKAIAVDGSGNLWVANAGNNSVTELNNAGAVISGAGGFVAGNLSAPSAIAIDLNGNAWIANSGNSTVTELDPTGKTATIYSGGGLSLPSSIAIDAINGVWVTNMGNSSVTSITAAGAVTSFTHVPANSPNAVAIDPK